MHVVTTNGTRWRRCNQFTDSLLFLTDPPPSVSSFFPLCGNAILFRDSPYTISFSRSYTHCLVVCLSMHSSPIVISCHCPFQSAVHTSIQSPSSDDSPHFHFSCLQVLFYSSPYPIPPFYIRHLCASCDISSWSTPLAQAPVQVYYIGHLTSTVYLYCLFLHSGVYPSSLVVITSCRPISSTF